MVPIAVLAANLFLQAFGGAWTCAQHAPGVVRPPATRWRIAAVPDSRWVEVQRQGRAGSAIGYVGYVPARRQWIALTFESDGGLTTAVSDGPQDGAWTWSAEFAMQRIEHGALQWRREGDGFRQGFGRLLGPSFRESASASCRPAPR